MSYSTVDLGKNIQYNDLESAIIKAAKEVGLKTKIKHRYSKGYRLGSVKEVQTYINTKIMLRGMLFPAMEIIMYGKEVRNYFDLSLGFGYGFASKRKVRKFLEALSENI